MLARVGSAILVGVEARLVEVQVDLSYQGLPGTQTVGLPGSAVRESQERIRSAIRNSGFEVRPARITVNLAPADLPKQGSFLDLAVAAGILLAEKGERPREGWVVAGELALDGTLRPIAGALPIAIAARAARSAGLLLPEANAQEAAAIGGLAVCGARDLAGAYAFLSGRCEREPTALEAYRPADPSSGGDDLAEIRGQAAARRALEVAAAGAHNLLLIGPPGTGKTMLARRLRTILPPLSREEAIEVTSVASAAGILPPGSGLARVRPFRSPHHSITPAGFVGGGAELRPGEVSLAHQGVLFLDELPEFERRLLDLLRQPIEEGTLTIVRSRHRFTLPSRFMLIAGMNPCPCGYRGSRSRPCRCTPHEVHRYTSRISGPLWDRIDLVVEVPPVPLEELTSGPAGEVSAVVRQRVERARAFRARRLLAVEEASRGPRSAVAGGARTDPAPASARLPRTSDSGIPGALATRAPAGTETVPAWDGVPGDVLAFLRSAAARLGLSARGATRLLRVARTVADLEGSWELTTAHLAEALSYRPRGEEP